jgi:hypothetical protein
MAVGLVSVYPFEIRPFIWRLKNVSAMSDFVQTVLWSDLKNVIFSRLRLKKIKEWGFEI